MEKKHHFKLIFFCLFRFLFSFFVDVIRWMSWPILCYSFAALNFLCVFSYIHRYENAHHILLASSFFFFFFLSAKIFLIYTHLFTLYHFLECLSFFAMPPPPEIQSFTLIFHSFYCHCASFVSFIPCMHAQSCSASPSAAAFFKRPLFLTCCSLQRNGGEQGITFFCVRQGTQRGVFGEVVKFVP